MLPPPNHTVMNLISYYILKPDQSQFNNLIAAVGGQKDLPLLWLCSKPDATPLVTALYYSCTPSIMLQPKSLYYGSSPNQMF